MSFKEISSRQNPIIKKVASLQEHKYRTSYGLFIAEGLRCVSTLLESPLELEQIYVTLKQLPALHHVAPDKITIVNDAIMEKISTTTTPSGIVGVFHIPQKPKPDQVRSGIVLANITDPGNMGTLIRSCAAMGHTTVIVVEGVDPWHPKVVTATAGTLGFVNIFSWSWEQVLKQKGVHKLYALVVAEGTPIEKISLNKGLLVIGSEAHGIPDVWLRGCDEKITIPMPGGIESLNAAVAGSIALYVTTQRKN